MRLLNSVLRPGKIIEVLESGQIKAEAPGLFSREDIDNLPPIRPFFNSHCNSFSAPKEGDEVWILSQNDNPLDLRWLRKDNIENNLDYIGDPECEILMNRETGEGTAIIYFTEANGIIIENNDSRIRIRQDGSIVLDANAPHRVIDINGNGISLGSSGSSEHTAAYGDEIEKLMNIIYSCLSTVQQAASGNVYTTPIGTAITPYLPQISAQIPNITSNNVTLD